jgi:HSP20 family molecular chaperone IbpA
VVVKENQIVISGSRRFQDQVQESGRRITTSNVQTFREAVPVEHPAVEKGVTREYKDGLLTVRIPKVGMKPPSGV